MTKAPPLIFNFAATLRCYRGLTIIGLPVCAVAWLTPSLLDLFGHSPALENPANPGIGPLVIVIVAALLLLLLIPKPLLTVFSGLLVGGVAANLIGRYFGPVADYILVPGSADHFFNLADLAIAVAPVVLFAGLAGQMLRQRSLLL